MCSQLSQLYFCMSQEDVYSVCGKFCRLHQTIMADKTKVQLIVILLLWQALATQIPCVHGRPGKIYGNPPSGKPIGCVLSVEVDKLCQQCAKHTKSNIVYPLCCDDKEDSQNFCRRYLDFGLQ